MQHARYWSCSAFADWLRGTKKLKAATAEDWDTWHSLAKNSHRVRYWMAEEGLDYLQDFVTWPVRKIYDLKYYINNRFVTRTHTLTAHARDIPRGEWCDVGNRFLPCLFNELVDFVEIETAGHYLAWNRELREKYNPPFWATGWFKWRAWQCKEAGLASLQWQSELTNIDWIDATDPEYGKPTPQAVNAQEIIDLYAWWTVTRPARPDPWVASGYRAVSEAERAENGGDALSFLSRTNSPFKKERDRAYKLLSKIERDYELEDTKMMKRLIDVRGSLWT